jgi:hypothetical protein
LPSLSAWPKHPPVLFVCLHYYSLRREYCSARIVLPQTRLFMFAPSS